MGQDDRTWSVTRMEDKPCCGRSYRVIEVDELLGCMDEGIAKVQGITGLHRTATRVLLDHYRWDTQRLMEDYFEGVRQTSVLVRAGVHSLDRCGLRVEQHVDGQHECSVCLDQVQSKDWVEVDCGHAFCAQCWSHYLSAQVMNVGVSASITCMATDCATALDDRLVLSLVSQPASHKFRLLLANSYVQRSSLHRWCPRPGSPTCERAIQCDGTVSEQTVTCLCGWSFCFRCGTKEDHRPLPCHLLRRWEAISQGQSQEWVKVFSRPCPMCSVPIQKNGGCEHMTCSNPGCGFDFCWTCMKKWHNSYSCSAKVKDPNQKKTKELELYTKSISLHDEQRTAIKKEAKFKPIIEAKTVGDRLQRERLLDVQESLLNSRRILLYTNIFTFFIRPSIHLEFLQFKIKALEQKVGKLSTRLEEEILRLKRINHGVLMYMEKLGQQCRSLSEGLVDIVDENVDSGTWAFKCLSV